MAKVKVRVKVKFTLEQATKAQMESRGIVLHFFNLGRFTRGKDPVPIV